MNEEVKMGKNKLVQSEIGFSIDGYLTSAILRCGAVSDKGAKTYGKGSYHQISYNDNVDHAIKHILNAKLAHDKWEKTAEDELAHAMCRLAMAMSKEVRNEH